MSTIIVHIIITCTQLSVNGMYMYMYTLPLSSPVEGPLLSGTVLPLLPLFRCLLLSVRQLFYTQTPPGLIVAVDGSLDVLEVGGEGGREGRREEAYM